MKRIDLEGSWRLTPDCIRGDYKWKRKRPVSFTIPGDIYSALIQSKIIPDPYVKRNELEVQWVGKSDWIIEREFNYSAYPYKRAFLVMTMVDTFVKVEINGETVLSCYNAFRRWEADVSDFLVNGNNTIRLYFRSPVEAAAEMAAQLPYPIPYTTYPVYSPYRNLIRKPQCHAGWDWGPCLMLMGINGTIGIEVRYKGSVKAFNPMVRRIDENKWAVDFEVTYDALHKCSECFIFSICGTKEKEEYLFEEGINRIVKTIYIEDPELWYPSGYGKQTLYEASLKYSEDTITKKIGFRTLILKNDKDVDGGISMVFSVNGKDIFAKGANWIPCDALYSRQNEYHYRYLLESMKEANMNMIRLWGGGQYEKEIFYELCDELGLLIWHDMMFACSMYPADEEFLDNVSHEITYQIERLKSHTSIALWCGNNEDIGAINWYEESRNNRERYLEDYIKLNDRTIGPLIEKLDPSRTFWPSSPSSGKDDFSDNWHSDSKGDMHYWSVWHEGKSFDAYYDIKPRFVSEFGYQSFPSLHTVEKYADKEDFNITSPVMEFHQKNDRGNSIIVENFTRYFRFPTSFEKMLYLSQVQQAMAMKMAISYYHSLRPRCMGTLYWQLNDVYPVASWSSIDYYGRWKLLHYAARRFYSPLSISSFIKDGRRFVYVINDTHIDVELKLKTCRIGFNGTILSEKVIKLDFPNGCSFKVIEEKAEEDPTSFYYYNLDDFTESILFNVKPKYCLIEDPEISCNVYRKDGRYFVTLEAKSGVPAFNVFIESSISGRFEDNDFTILGNAPVTVEFIPFENIDINEEELLQTLSVMDLYSASH